MLLPWAYRLITRSQIRPFHYLLPAATPPDFPKSSAFFTPSWDLPADVRLPLRAERRLPLAVREPVERPPCSLHRPERYRSRRLHGVPARVRAPQVSLDSTSIKVHPNGTGALKKTAHSPSASPEVDGTPRFIWLPRMLERP